MTNEAEPKYLGHITNTNKFDPRSTIHEVTFEHGVAPFETRCLCNFLNSIRKSDVFYLSDGNVVKIPDIEERTNKKLAATILIYSDKSWDLVFSDNATPEIRAMCEANMNNNWHDEDRYFEENPELVSHTPKKRGRPRKIKEPDDIQGLGALFK